MMIERSGLDSGCVQIREHDIRRRRKKLKELTSSRRGILSKDMS